MKPRPTILFWKTKKNKVIFLLAALFLAFITLQCNLVNIAAPDPIAAETQDAAEMETDIAAYRETDTYEHEATEDAISDATEFAPNYGVPYTPTHVSVLNIWDFIVGYNGTMENYSTDTIGMVHLGDEVVLRGPITVRLRVHYHEYDTGPEIQVTDELIQIANGGTWDYYLDEASTDHPGNWDASIQLISINQ